MSDLTDEERAYLERTKGDSALEREEHPVYEPREDTELIRRHISEYARGTVLDMGTGAGTLAIEAGTYAEQVYGADINPKAIAQCQDQKNVRFLESDLFSHPELQRSFDLIIFNPPYLPKDPGVEDVALFGGKHGYEVITRFLECVNDYLSSDGRVLLLFSTLSRKEKVHEAIERNMLEWTCLERERIFFEELYVYELRKNAIRREMEDAGISGIRYLARGKRGMVYTGSYQELPVTVKMKHPASEAMNRIKIEAGWLRRLQPEGIGPRLVLAREHFLVYEYVQGEPIERFIQGAGQERIREVLRDLLWQLFRLDQLGIDKEEMHHPTKHVLVGERPVLIDFERANHSQRPKNVTQFCHYLASPRCHALLAERGIELDKEALIRIARGYSRRRDEAAFREILGLL